MLKWRKNEKNRARNNKRNALYFSMRRYIERHVEDKLANITIENYGKDIFGMSLSVKDNDISVEFI